MSELDELAATKVLLKKTGDLYQKIDGADVVIAHYDRNTGHLEFTTKENSSKFYAQCVAKIATVAKGTEVSGNKIRSFGVKGDAVIDRKNLPKRPKLGPLGDAGEDYVQWMLDHDMPQAIIRYGIYTDAKGNPIRKPVRRIVENTVDARDEDTDNLAWVKDGNKSQVRAPVMRKPEIQPEKSGIIARRATALTYAPAEVIGGFSVDDDGDADLSMEGDE